MKKLLGIFLLLVSMASCDKKDSEPKCIDKSKITNTPCTQEYAPVCGCDGQTYQNACVAGNAGVVRWTKGPCAKPNPDPEVCIDKTKIDLDRPCTKELKPVCGCDGVTYSNPCDAERHGVLKYKDGKCDGGNTGGGEEPKPCVDKSKIDLNRPCPADAKPVCGCDGKTYNNPCDAERNGVTLYKPGRCDGGNTDGGNTGGGTGGGTSDGCIDKAKIDLNRVCPTDVKQVCGCDGKTYNNPCEAEKNGVLKYKAGPCGK